MTVVWCKTSAIRSRFVPFSGRQEIGSLLEESDDLPFTGIHTAGVASSKLALPTNKINGVALEKP